MKKVTALQKHGELWRGIELLAERDSYLAKSDLPQNQRNILRAENEMLERQLKRLVRQIPSKIVYT